MAMNPSGVGGARAFNDLYAGVDDDEEPPMAQKRPLALTHQSGDEGPSSSKSARMEAGGEPAMAGPNSYNDRKIFVGSLPPNFTEKPLKLYFQGFGTVKECRVIRDKATGISRGFAFVTFLDETMAEAAIAAPKHVIEGKEVRVSTPKAPGENPGVGPGGAGGGAPGGGEGQQKPDYTFNRNRIGPNDSRWMEENYVIPVQTRCYVGPLDANVNREDLVRQFQEFGAMTGVAIVGGSTSSSAATKSYGIVDYKEPISVRRAFISKIFVKGKFVKVTCSRFAIELVNNPHVAFFCEAHLFCDDDNLEAHFSKFGTIYRAIHLPDSTKSEGHKSYGFVDYIREDSAERAILDKSQLLHPGQFVRVARNLPQRMMYDLFSIGDKAGQQIVKRLERKIPMEGKFGSAKNMAVIDKSAVTTTKVRIPAAAVSRVIGERGKTVSEICRDSKTQISVPKPEEGSNNVIVTISGRKQDITTAQYLMQKAIRGLK